LSAEAKKRSDEIDRFLKQESIKFDPSKSVFLLLLGSADSGKTTVVKQLIILHGKGFTEEQRQQTRNDIKHTLLKNSKLVLQEMVKRDIQIEPDLRELLKLSEPDDSALQSLTRLSELEILKDLAKTAVIPGFDDSSNASLIQRTRSQMMVFDPTTDVLRSRRRTDNIYETQFMIQHRYWNIIDVAGQKDSRNRWTHYFEKNIHAVLYVLSAAGFCQVMEECPDMNRISDSIELFQSLLSNPNFKPPSYIIFFNKIDLLEDRLQKHKISDFIPAYQHPNTKEEYLKWLWSEFKKMASKSNPTVSIYLFNTTATDTKLMRKVTSSVQYLR
ncbi:guanine nucleotide binding protein, alpha subunit, partial [Gorgonomyces haynaldii]